MTSIALTARSALADWSAGPRALRIADIAAMLIALTLPWSTTLSAVAIGLWLAAILASADRRDVAAALRHPASIAAIALFALGALGTLWADVSWSARMVGLGRFVKLLAIPFLLYHFRKSDRGTWICAVFLVSCLGVLLASFVQVAFPQLARSSFQVGVPVKNYIVQSQEFTLCAFALAYPALRLFQDGRKVAAAGVTALALLFVANMLSVISSRTALFALISLLGLFCLRFLRGRSMATMLIGATLLTALAWTSSPTLRQRTTEILLQLDQYRQGDEITSTGQRLEYWRKSLGFVAEAPIMGHGTGSIQSLFERAAVGKTGLEAEVINNPHNQTLAVAVQLGLIGVIALYAMWLIHLRLFTGDGFPAWLGLVVVTENVVTSLFNSHLFDSAEGWIYVLGVGVAGGMILKERGMAAARP